MYLTRRDILAWVLILLASACWVFGIALANDPAELDVFTNMEPGDTSETSTYLTGPTTFVTTTVTGLTSEAATSVSADAEDFTEPDESAYHVSDDYSMLKRVAGIMLCAGSVCLTVVSVLVLRQNNAVLGPDGACLVLGILFTVCRAVAVDHGSLLMPWVRFMRAVLNIFFVFSVLVSLREVFCWIVSGFSAKNCLSFRIAGACKRPQFSLVFFALWIMLAFAGCFLLFLAKMDGRRFWVVPFVFYAAMLVLGGVCLWRYGTDLYHFKKQLTNYQNGLPITVGNGVFAETEAQLLDVQAKHEEAVKTAVTSERFKVELISNVSHDLRTPMTSIMGYGELLEKEALSPEGKEQLKRLNLKAGYMNELVDSLFELTKVSSGVVTPQMEKIDLVCLLEQTVGFFDDRLSESGLVVRRNYGAETLPVYTDGARMHRVFSNLLGNAIKYAMKGTRIYIDVVTAGDRYRIRMLNTASYEMDFKSDEIVKRFARGDKARSTTGSGLGLAIAKTYTESVGGEFYVTVDGDQFCAVTELPKNVRDL